MIFFLQLFLFGSAFLFFRIFFLFPALEIFLLITITFYQTVYYKQCFWSGNFYFYVFFRLFFQPEWQNKIDSLSVIGFLSSNLIFTSSRFRSLPATGSGSKMQVVLRREVFAGNFKKREKAFMQILAFSLVVFCSNAVI